jgi:hypothetical protein
MPLPPTDESVDKRAPEGYPHAMNPAIPPVAEHTQDGMPERRFGRHRPKGVAAAAIAMTTRPDEAS